MSAPEVINRQGDLSKRDLWSLHERRAGGRSDPPQPSCHPAPASHPHSGRPWRRALSPSSTSPSSPRATPHRRRQKSSSLALSSSSLGPNGCGAIFPRDATLSFNPRSSPEPADEDGGDAVSVQLADFARNGTTCGAGGRGRRRAAA
jgi:hypothetical protein